MVSRNRLFPYPVLCEETNDYQETTDFVIESNITEKTFELEFNYDFLLKCDAIETLIRKGEAEYVLHVECSATAFRIALKTDIPHIEYHLPKSRVNGEINLVAMIVAQMDINDYKSNDLNEDYEGESISFNKGAILAYKNLPAIYVHKKTEELAKSEPLFSVVKKKSVDDSEIKPLSFNLNNSRIQIIVDEKTYDSFVHFKSIKAIPNAMLVLPALIYMINEVSASPDSYKQYLWFQRMERFYQLQNLDFLNDVINKDDNPVNIAQEMLQNPTSKAFRELLALEG